jgi:hypothetical protein
MPPKGLAKVNNLIAPRAWLYSQGYAFYQHKNKLGITREKSLVKSINSNKSRKCSNTMLEGPPTKR